MISSISDQTNALNKNSATILNVGGVNTATIHIVGSNGAITWTGSNDQVVANFTAVQAINLSTGVAATSASANGLYQITTSFNYLRLSGTGLVVTQVFVLLNKLN